MNNYPKKLFKLLILFIIFLFKGIILNVSTIVFKLAIR